MGQMIGYLRENRATHGEKLVLNKLGTALPDDFYVYVECPLQHRRIQRFPDFIIVCNSATTFNASPDPATARWRRCGGPGPTYSTLT